MPCPAGTYASAAGSASFAACGACTAAAGSFCGPASIAAGGSPCTLGFSCAGGAAAPVRCTCSAGYSCPAGTAVGGNGTTTTCATVCPAGYYCLPSTPPLPCPAGSYSAGGATFVSASKCLPCNAGRYGLTPPGAAGSVAPTCSGPCAAGYYCQPYSTSAFGGGGSSSGTGGVCPASFACPSATALVLPMCARGFWCGPGTAAVDQAACGGCPGGVTCAAGASSALCGVACAIGFYCPAGGVPLSCVCPAGLTCGAGLAAPACVTTCPAGYFCALGVPVVPCAAGSYGSVTGASSAATGCTACSAAAGSYCAPGGTAAAGAACPSGYYCLGGAADKVPVSCVAGTSLNAGQAVPAGATSAAAACAPCSAGAYCLAGTVPLPCPPGSYFSGSGGVSVAACVACAAGAGAYCPAGSAASGGVVCPMAFGCAGGAALPVACACDAGRACGAGLAAPSVGTTGGCVSACPAGYFCVNATAPIPCPAGTYSGGGVGFTAAATCLPCAPGRFGLTSAGAPGNTAASCSGPCVAGWYCPAASTSATQLACMPGSYCLAATATVLPPCAQGYFCAAGSATASQALCVSCPAGVMCSSGIAAASCSVACAVGHVCAAGAAPVPCASCPAGLTCGGGLAAVSCLTTCPAGFWCAVSAAMVACAAGTYSATTGASAVSTCLSCTAQPGAYCAAGSAAAAGSPCPSGYWCSGGTANKAPLSCVSGATLNTGFAGALGAASSDPATCTTGNCSAGYYCLAGTVPQPCAAGSYAGSPGGASAAACVACTCAPGAFCAAGSAAAAGAPCTLGFSCAGGAVAPVPCACAAGYACPAGTAVAGTGSTGTCSAVCPAGYFCVASTPPIACPAGTHAPGGLAFTSAATCLPCNPGTFGLKAPGAPGNTAATCSGACAAGFYCPAGSTSATQLPCVGGRYCLAGIATVLPTCSRGCACATGAGSACTAACASCPDGVMCPAGVPAPVCSAPCDIGYFCAAGALPVPCGSCPAGFTCGGGLSAPACTTTCPAGYYCPLNTTLTPCAAGTYSAATGASAASVCAACTATPGAYCAPASTTAVGALCPSGYSCAGGQADKAPRSCVSGAANNAGYALPTGLPPAGTCTTAGCAAGFYCLAGSVPLPCPAGSFVSAAGASSSAACTQCTAGAGSYCAAGSAAGAGVPCPLGFSCNGGTALPVACACAAGYACAAGTSAPGTGSTGSCALACPVGYGCAAAVPPLPCPAGRYSTGGAAFTSLAACLPCSPGQFGLTPPGTPGSASSSCTAACNASYYCPAASTTGTQFRCAQLGYYCPVAAPTPTRFLCAAGYYGASAPQTVATCTGQCSPGFYCLAQSTSPRQAPCAAGRYGDMPGLPTALCTGLCVPGSYCPLNSTRATQVPCPAGKYGATLGLPNSTCSGLCRSGYYCPKNSTSATQLACPAGRYGATNGLPDALCTGLCSTGHYCPAASTNETSVRCPAGLYGGAPGLTAAACNGACAPGFYCVSASVRVNQTACGERRLYCPLGSPAPLLCPAGSYTIGAANATTAAQMSAIATCTPGTYCPVNTGKQLGCPTPAVSYWGVGAGAVCCTTSNMSQPIVCPAGYWCGTAGTCSVPVVCGNVTVYCPAGSPLPTPVSVNFYTEPAYTSTASVRTFQTECTQGQQCAGGLMSECAKGFARWTRDALVCTACPHGYYCPGKLPAVPCGNSTLFCAVPGNPPVNVDAGYYSIGSSSITGYAQTFCEQGNWCQYGIKTPCPPGYFGCSTHTIDPLCNGKCFAGYFCRLGAQSAQAEACGNVTVYCPTGSSEPLPVPTGYYSVGGLPTTRGEVVRCGPGTYCIAGVQSLCSAGRYGLLYEETNRSCSGACYDGFLCVAGSFSPNSTLCPVGFFCVGGKQAQACPPGSYMDVEGGKAPSDCRLCPSNTFSAIVGAYSRLQCEACRSVASDLPGHLDLPPAQEGAPPGSTACWPALRYAIINDPPPTVPGLSVGDTVSLYFSKPTNEPLAGAIVNLSAVVGTFSLTWTTQSTVLVLAVVDPSTATPDADAYQPNVLRVGVLAGAGLKDQQQRSAPLAASWVTAIGSWGAVTQPLLLKVTARNTGRQAGFGVGDSIVLDFDQDVAQLPVRDAAALDAFLVFSAPFGTEYSGTWAARTQLVVTVVQDNRAGGRVDQAAYEWRVLNVTLLASGRLTSFDRQSTPADGSLSLSGGSWGDTPAHVYVRVHSATALVLQVVIPLWIPYAPTTLWVRYVDLASGVNGSLEMKFADAPRGAPAAPEQPPPYLFYVTGLEPRAPHEVFAAVYNLVEYGPWVPGEPVVSPIRPLPPAVTSVRSLASSLATPGGDVFYVSGDHLGYAGISSIEVVYWNQFGSLVVAHGCVVEASYLVLRCLSAPGVGTSLAFRVSVDGFVSPVVNTTLRYFAPSISIFTVLVGGAGSTFNTEPNATVLITGGNFGPLGSANINGVYYTSASTKWTFVVQHCVVTIPDVQIQCHTPASTGSNHAWTLIIGGQSSSAPSTNVKAPAIDTVDVLGGGDRGALATTGGDVIVINGSNFGPDVRYVDDVWSTRSDVSPPVTLSAHTGARVKPCWMTVPHKQIMCYNPAQVGTRYVWSVRVDGLSSNPSSQTTSYKPPVLSSAYVQGYLAGAVLTTMGGAVVVVAGDSFGASAADVSIRMADSVGTLLPASIQTPQTAVSFVAPPVNALSISFVVIVAGQVSGAGTVPVAPPSISAVLMDIEKSRTLDPSIYPLQLVGASFGSCCAGVTVNGAPVIAVYASSNAEVSFMTLVRAGTVVVTVGPRSASTTYDVDSILRKPLILSITPRLFDTRGGRALLVGTSFKSTGAVVVNVGRDSKAPCVAEDGLYFDTNITCLVPPGGGAGLTFTVFTYRVESPEYTGCGYLPPVVGALAPTAGPTTGGTVLQLNGSNFGLGGSVTVGKLLCWPILSWSQLFVECVTPPGFEVALPVVVTVEGQSSSSDASLRNFSYGPPVVTIVSPSHAPTSGNVALSVIGQNFGAAGVTLSVTVGGIACVVAPGHNDTSFSCVLGEGVGVGLAVSVVTTAQAGGSAPGVAFSYDPPAIRSVTCSGGRPRVGGFVCTVAGASFSSAPLVTLGVDPCRITSRSHIAVTCVAPAARASNATLLILTTSADAVAATNFSYDAPVIDSWLPVVGNANDAFMLTLVGRNFGVDITSSRAVTIVTDACTNIVFTGDAQLSCTAPGYGFSAVRNITVAVDGATSNVVEVMFVCPPGTYLGERLRCFGCPEGARCAGWAADPVPLDGYWRVARTEFVLCIPQEACVALSPGDNSTSNCAPQYTLNQCRKCSHGFFRKVGEQRCSPCPGNAIILICVFLIGVVGCGGLAAWLHRNMFNLKGAGGGARGVAGRVC